MPRSIQVMRRETSSIKPMVGRVGHGLAVGLRISRDQDPEIRSGLQAGALMAGVSKDDHLHPIAALHNGPPDPVHRRCDGHVNALDVPAKFGRFSTPC